MTMPAIPSLSLLLVLLPMVAGVQSWAADGAALVTRAGTLTVAPQPWNPAAHKVDLNGETVLGGGFITLYATYELGTQDVVLVGDEGALRLLVLEPGKQPRAFLDRHFFSADGTRDAVLKDGRLEIDLGSDSGRHKVAVYDGARLSFVFDAAGSPAWTEEDNTIATRSGILTVVQSKPESRPDTIKLGEATVFQAEDFDFVTLYGKYPVGAQDVVVVGVNCGGTACAMGDTLSLLVLEAGKQPRTLSDERFFGQGSSAALKDGLLEFDLGWSGGKRELARYDGKDLSITFEDRGHPPLTKEECKEIYDNTMATCAFERHVEPDCKNPTGWTSGFSWRSIAPIMQKPGFVQRGYTQACVAACKRGKAPPLDASFRKGVCAIGK